MSDNKNVEVQVTFKGELAKRCPLIALSLFFKRLNHDLFNIFDGPEFLLIIALLPIVSLSISATFNLFASEG